MYHARTGIRRDMSRRKKTAEPTLDDFPYTEEMKERARERIEERLRNEDYWLVERQYIEVCFRYFLRRYNEEREKGRLKAKGESPVSSELTSAPSHASDSHTPAAQISVPPVSSRARFSILGRRSRTLHRSDR